MTHSSVRRRLNVVVVCNDYAYMRQMLEAGCGHNVMDQTASSRRMLHIVAKNAPDMDVIVFDLMLHDGSGLEALRKVYDQQQACAAVAIAEVEDQDALMAAVGEFHLACVVRPVRECDLKLALAVSVTNFEQICSLRQELEDRKIIERAKGILMSRHGWTEDTAYRWLRQQAMNGHCRLVVVAQSIIGIPKRK